MRHEERLARIQAVMADNGLDAILSFSPADHHVDWGDAVMLLSGVKPLGPSVALLTRDGATGLSVTPEWDLARVSRLSMADQVASADTLQACLIQTLEHLPSGARIGTVHLEIIPHVEGRRLRSLMGDAQTDVSREVYDAASCKTVDEIEYARKATEIAEQTMAYLRDIVRPGLAECDVAAALKAHSLMLGADDNFMMFHAAAHPDAVQPANTRKFEAGDLILAEVTPSYKGQFTQVCRTLCVGQATDVQIEKYDLVARALKAGIETIRPGSRMSDICNAIDAVLTDAGYRKYCEPPFMNRRGHGLGTTSIRPGNVSLTNDTRLEPGMFFVVHPNQYIPEAGYFLCGDPVLVTETGHEVLTTSPPELISIPIRT